jgi:hypothetical protein
MAMLKRMGKKKEVMNKVERRKMEYPGQIMRNDTQYKLLILHFSGKSAWREGYVRDMFQEPEDMVFTNIHRANSYRR